METGMVHDGFVPAIVPIYDNGDLTPYFINLFPLQKFSNMSLTSPRIDHRYYLNTFAAPQLPDIPFIPGDIVRFNMEQDSFILESLAKTFGKTVVDLEKMDLIVVFPRSLSFAKCKLLLNSSPNLLAKAVFLLE